MPRTPSRSGLGLPARSARCASSMQLGLAPLQADVDDELLLAGEERLVLDGRRVAGRLQGLGGGRRRHPGRRAGIHLRRRRGRARRLPGCVGVTSWEVAPGRGRLSPIRASSWAICGLERAQPGLDVLGRLLQPATAACRRFSM